jgi:hypothetical protein
VNTWPFLFITCVKVPVPYLSFLLHPKLAGDRLISDLLHKGQLDENVHVSNLERTVSYFETIYPLHLHDIRYLYRGEMTRLGLEETVTGTDKNSTLALFLITRPRLVLLIRLGIQIRKKVLKAPPPLPGKLILVKICILFIEANVIGF